MDLSPNVANSQRFRATVYGFANFGRVFTAIHCETLSWVTLSSWEVHYVLHVFLAVDFTAP